MKALKMALVFAIFCTVGCSKTVDRGGYLTRAKGQIIDINTDQPLANYKLFILEKASSNNPSLGLTVDSLRTDAQGKYELSFISNNQSSYILYIPGKQDSVSCYASIVLQEGKSMALDVKLVPEKPLFTIDCQQVATNMGATSAILEMYTTRCDYPVKKLGNGNFVKTFGVLEKTKYYFEITLFDEFNAIYFQKDSIDIATIPVVYTLK